jgi:hypothetical protein
VELNVETIKKMKDKGKKLDEDESQFPYELTIVIKKGTVEGGGLANSAHVITSIDGVEINKTADAVSPPQWNQTIVKRIQQVQRKDPIVIGFSVYKKRWTAPGYKIVGSTQYRLTELLPFINKKPVEKEIQLNTSRSNLTMRGTLSLSFQLKEIAVKKKANDDVIVEAPFTWVEQLRKWKIVLAALCIGLIVVLLFLGLWKLSRSAPSIDQTMDLLTSRLTTTPRSES